MVRVLRVTLATEGLLISWRTLRSTRRLEERREHGDQSVKGAVALTPQGRLFEVPNGLSASVYFALMAFLSLTGLIDRPVFRRFGLALAWISLGISGYLVYQLLFVLKRNCPLCMRTHTLNLALTLLLTARAVQQETQDQ